MCCRASARWLRTTNRSGSSPWTESRPRPRGVPQIEVTFDIDANGILKVTAKDKATGRSQHITITASSGLSEAEVEKMRQDAEAHADEDRKRRELIEARNQADNTAYAAEKAIREFGDKVPAELKSEIEAKVADLRSKAQGEDVSRHQVRQRSARASHPEDRCRRLPGAACRRPAGSRVNQANRRPRPDVVDGEVKE